MMPSTLPDRSAFVLSMILLVILVVTAGGMGVFVASDPRIIEAIYLIRAALEVKEEYISEVRAEELVVPARREMFSLLDRYSYYIEANSFSRMQEELSGSYGGIGIMVVRHPLGLQIMSVREDGPAGKAGMVSGDIIIAADSVSLAGLSVNESSNLLRGEEGTTVSVTVLHTATQDTTEYVLTRAMLPLIHIPYAGLTADSILYIRLLDFEAGTTLQLQAVFDSLLAAHPRGILLDLRGNPGGLFQEAWHVASLFLPEGTFIVGTRGRSRWKNERHTAVGPDVTNGLPMAILVDNGSASSAEIVAGALQQAGRAVLVGDTTFGKGLVQGFIQFPDGDGLRLTISRYYFGNGLFLNAFDSTLHDTGHGLPPDYYYVYPKRNDVIRELEKTLILYHFADAYRDEILASTPEQLQSSHWIKRLVAFLKEQDFQYESLITSQVEEMIRRAKQDICDEKTFSYIQHLLTVSKQQDWTDIRQAMDYISLKLLQIATERRYGTYRAYKDVVVPLRPDIQFALEIIRKQT